jgi:hypothetical protein
MPAVARRESFYAPRIRETAARLGFIGTDPRHIEAYMRLEHSTLDGLAEWQFNAEVETACACVAVDGTEGAEACARSFGL